ncbi:tetratricopeptide repeat protein [bacterium]|nr:tetratricopeptide repeat protein [bacterium]
MSFMGMLPYLVALFLVALVFVIYRARRKVKATEESSAETSYLRGLDFLIYDKRDLAIRELTSATLKNTDDVSAYISLGNLHREQGNIDRAIRIHESVSIRPNLSRDAKVRALYSLGLDYVRGGLLDRARSAFRSAIKEDPTRIESYESLERVYEELKDWKRAYHCQLAVDKAAKKKSSRLLAYLLTEMALAEALQNSRTKEAIELLQKAKQTDPTCISVLMYLGDVYISQGDFKKAEQAWEHAVEQFPKLAFLLFDRLRQVYLKQDAVQNIKAIYNVVLAKNPDDINARKSLGDYYFDTGQLDKAEEEYSKIIEISSGSTLGYQKLGMVLLKEGRKDEALDVYQRLASLPELKVVYYYCGKCGFKDTTIHWRCPQCHEWDTFVQEIERRRVPAGQKRKRADAPKEAH